MPNADHIATVQERLDALQHEREGTWTQERLAERAQWLRDLEEDADREAFVAVGQRVPPFALAEVDGGVVELDALLETGPVVLIFFRFATCPACNAAFGGYRDLLAPELARLGAHLVAISPQVPERLVDFKTNLGLDFHVASDPEATLLHAFGIAFGPDEFEQEVQRKEGSDLGELLGTGRWELPYPTVVVVDRGGIVRFADVHPDWMVRTEAATIIEAVKALD
jgi:peroxiredoxin